MHHLPSFFIIATVEVSEELAVHFVSFYFTILLWMYAFYSDLNVLLHTSFIVKSSFIT